MQANPGQGSGQWHSLKDLTHSFSGHSHLWGAYVSTGITAVVFCFFFLLDECHLDSGFMDVRG